MQPRTDLAVESAAVFSKELPQGVRMKEYGQGRIHVTHMVVETQSAALRIGRDVGNYYTMELPGLDEGTQDCDLVTAELEKVLQQVLPSEGSVLVVGLGNRAMTPDALGPCCAERVLATRHLPPDFHGAMGLETPLREVCTLSPGVLASTGLESAAVVEAVVRRVHPGCVVAIDAMAAAAWERLGNTIQVSDGGIAPGAGVHNARRELSKKTLGIPVVSMGIPTVVDGSSLVHSMLGDGDARLPEGAASLTVTPRNIDALIERGAYCISLALNRALQPALSTEDILFLLG